MRSKHLTLTVIPEAGKEAYSMGFPQIALILALIVLFSSLVALAVLVKVGVEKAVNASTVRMQGEENRAISQKLEEFNRELALIAARVDTLKLLEKRVRELSHIEHESQAASVSEEEGDGEWTHQSEDDVSARLDALLEDAQTTREEFEQLVQSLAVKEHTLNHTPSIRPAAGWLISGYGYTKNPFTGRTEMHMGVDIAALEGTPICATADGRVSFVGHKPGYGLTVVIDHGSQIRTWYGHCSKAKVKSGELVKRGSVIAFIGKTGQAIGPHVQYEVRVMGEPVDPADFFLDTAESEY